MYKNDPRIWNAIMEMVCEHFAGLERTGVDLGLHNGRVFPIVIGNKGDWSYLVPWLDSYMFSICKLCTCRLLYISKKCGFIYLCLGALHGVSLSIYIYIYIHTYMGLYNSCWFNPLGIYNMLWPGTSHVFPCRWHLQTLRDHTGGHPRVLRKVMMVRGLLEFATYV